MNAGNLQGMPGARAPGMGYQQSQPGGIQRTNGGPQIQQHIARIISQQPHPVGWQTSVLLPQRVINVFSLVSSLRLIKPDMEVSGAIQVAVIFEQKTFVESQDKAAYEAQCRAKLAEVQQARSRQAQHVQQQLQNAQNPQMNFQNAQMARMHQMSMQNMMPNQNPGQIQQSFANPQLQHPMQASPIPMQQRPSQQPQQMSMANNVANAQAPGQPRPLQQSQPTQNNGPIQSTQGSAQSAFTPEEQQHIGNLAAQIAMKTSREEKEMIKQKLATLPAEQRSMWQRQRIEPLHAYFRNQAVRIFNSQRAKMSAGQSATGSIPPQSRPQPSSVQGQTAQTGAVSAPQSFDNPLVAGKMDQILGLRQDALRSQEQGQVVVPASNSQRVPQQQQGLGHQNLGRPIQTPGTVQQQQQQILQAQQKQQQQAQQQERIQQTARLQAQSQIQGPVSNQSQASQHTPLQGQVGGLNAHSAQGFPQQSPAMPNLNRPFGPSSQNSQTQGTPQPRSQQRQPQGNQGTISEPPMMQPTMTSQPQNPAQQQHQPQRGPAGGQNVNLQRLRAMQSLPPQLQAKLSTLPEHQRMPYLKQYQQRVMQNNGRAAMGPGFVPPPGIGAPSAQQQSSKVQGNNQGIDNQGTGIPNNGPSQQLGASSEQPSTGSSNQSFGQLPPQQIYRNILHNQNPLTEEQTRSMDRTPFPPGILNSSVVLSSLPPNIKTWGHLKQWVAQNKHSIPEEIPAKLKGLQALHYQSLPAEKKAQLQQLGNQPMPYQNYMPVGQPVGPAPTAPMSQSRSGGQIVPGLNGPQPSQLGNNTRLPPPSMQEIQNARARLPEQMKHYTDDQLAQLIQNHKLNQMRANPSLHNLQGQSGLTQDQAQMIQMQKAHREQAQQQLVQRQMSQNGQRQQPPQPQPLHRPQQQTPVQNGKNGMQSTAKGSLQSQQNRTGPQPTPTQFNQKGIKRSNNDDVIEVSNPNRTLQQPQRSTKQPTQQNELQMPGLNPQQNTALKAQYESQARKSGAQQGSALSAASLGSGAQANLQNNEMRQNADLNPRLQRLNEILSEVVQTTPDRPAITMSQQTREAMATDLYNARMMVQRLGESLDMYFCQSPAGDETVVRDLARMQLLLRRQYRDSSFNPAEQFTITPQELGAFLVRLKKFFQHVLQTVLRQRNNPPGFQAGQKQLQDGQLQPLSRGQMMLTGENLKQHQQAEQQALQNNRQTSLQRTHSNRDDKPPADPTSVQPPFPFGATSPPPHGIPQAYGATNLTQDNLKFPDRKRRKGNQTGSSAPTPTQNQGTPGSISSPKAVKAPSPDTRRVQGTATMFKCSVPDCSNGAVGYSTAEDLAKHNAEVHEPNEPVIEDALKYTLESLRIGLKLDSDGNPLASKDTKPGATTFESQSTMASTPMSRALTQSASQHAASLLKTPQTSASMKTSQSGAKVLTPNADKSSSAKASSTEANAPKTPPHDPWADISVSPTALSDCFPTLADLECSLDLSSFTPPTTVPSDKSDKNSPQAKLSDISENDALNIKVDTANWMPKEWFHNAIHTKIEDVVGDEELLGMTWQEAFGDIEEDMLVDSGNGKDGKSSKNKDRTGASKAFDPSLWRIRAE